MSDRHTHEQRRYNMQQIKGKNTKPEISLRKLLFAEGEYSAVNYTTIPRQSAPLIPRQSAPLKCII